MLSANSSELTGFIDSDLTWKGSKGRRNKSRKAKKSVSGILKGGAKNLETLDMPVSESEKLGVSVLGCRFSERAQDVPIKKRRLVYRSPSPPPRAPLPRSGETETSRLLKIKPGIIDRTGSANDTGQIVDKECDVDEANLVSVDKHVETEDFSGMSILAAAACNKGFRGDGVHIEESSRVEESYLHESRFDISTDNQLFSLSKGVCKGDLSTAAISNEGTSCISAMSQEVIAACPRTDYFSANHLSSINMEDDSVQNHLVAVSKDLLTNGEEENKHDFSSREVRLHWDLNTAMDSWKDPSDDEFAVSNTNGSNGIAEDGGHVNCRDKMRNLEGYELQCSADDSKPISEKELPHSDCGEMAHVTEQSNIQEQKSELKNFLSSELECAVNMDQSKGKELLDSQERISVIGRSVDFVPADNFKRHLTSTVDDKSSSDPIVSVGCMGTNGGLSPDRVGILVSDADKNLPVKSNHCASGSAAKAGTCTFFGSQAEKQETAPVVALSSKSTGEMSVVLNKTVDEAKEISCPSDWTILPNDMGAMETGQPMKTGPLDGGLYNSVCSLFSDVEMPTSGASVEVQPISVVDLKVIQDKLCSHDSSETNDLKVHQDKICSHDCCETADLKVQQDKVYLHDVSETDNLMVDKGKELGTKCIERPAGLLQPPSVLSNHDDLVYSSDAMALEEPPDKGDCSDDHVDSKLGELEGDHDSQYEDGEVRESIVNAWDEYDEDMEAEHVDYGSDNASDMSCDSENTTKNTKEFIFQSSITGSLGSAEQRPVKGGDRRNELTSGDEVGPGKVTGDVDVVAREDEAKKPSVSADSILKLSDWNDRKFSDASTGEKEGNSRKNLIDDCKDGLDTEDTKPRMVRSREFRPELRSYIDGRPVHDADSNVKTYMQGSSDADNTTPRLEREPGYVQSFGRGRYNYRAHARYHGDDHWVSSTDSYRGIRRYRSPNYHGPAPFRRSGPESGSFGRQNMDDSSLSVHRRLARSRSPVDGEENFRLRSGFRPYREQSPGRRVTFGRGRSLRYCSQIDGRGPRGRYHRPIPDDAEPFLNHSHPSTRRERCFSPTHRRSGGHAHISHSRSPSRSITRSPNSGNPSLRHRSKSPDFKSEVRMQNVRSPYQRPGFLADRMVGFRTMRRSHGSPPQNSRWYGDRRDGVVNFREQGFNQRSSGLDRFGPQDDRFDMVDSVRNYRTFHPGRFSKFDGVGRGRMRHDGSNDNRGGRHSYRFGLVRPEKRYDIDRNEKRFRNYDNDGFVKAHDSRFEDTSAFNDTAAFSDRQDLRNLAGALEAVSQEDLEKREGHAYIKETENMLVQNHT